MQAIVLPSAAIDGLAARIAGKFELTPLSNHIFTARHTIAPADATPQSPFESGLFVLQYIAPATPAWQRLLQDGGIEVIERLPERTVIVVATVYEIRTISALGWVR
ncbi:MAG: hypothetical protein QOJ98_2243, partial [Acidobacteriota bacterium]|nr:hypothetical protein [Acidobacteriota bacterium]